MTLIANGYFLALACIEAHVFHRFFCQLSSQCTVFKYIDIVLLVFAFRNMHDSVDFEIVCAFKDAENLLKL